MERGRVILGGRPALGEAVDARGEQEGTVGAGERIAYGLDRGLARLRSRRPGWTSRACSWMNDGFGGLGASPDAREIVEVTAADQRPLCLEGSG